MTAKGFDYYDQITAAVHPSPTPTATTATATAAPQAATTTATRPYFKRLAESTLFNASVILLVFAAFICSAGTVLALLPLGWVTPEQDFGLWFGTIAGVLAMSGAITGVLAMAVLR